MLVPLNKRNLMISFVLDTNMAASSFVFGVFRKCVKVKNFRFYMFLELTGTTQNLHMVKRSGSSNHAQLPLLHHSAR